MERETVQLPARGLERAEEWRRFVGGVGNVHRRPVETRGFRVAITPKGSILWMSEWLTGLPFPRALICNIAFLTLFSLENGRLNPRLSRVQRHADRYTSPVKSVEAVRECKRWNKMDNGNGRDIKLNTCWTWSNVIISRHMRSTDITLNF